jgi:hypothetical protein
MDDKADIPVGDKIMTMMAYLFPNGGPQTPP